MKYSLLSLLLLVTSSLYATHLSFTEGVVESGDFELNRVVTRGEGYIEVSYQLGGVSIEKTTVNDQVLHLIRMNNAAVLEEKGNPELPVYLDKVSVASAQVNVNVVDATYKEYKEFLVYPSRGPIVQSAVDSVGTLYFSDVYGKNALFPSNNVAVSDIQSFRSYPFATVRFCPVQYNPVTKVIKCCTSITYRISWNKRDYVSNSDLPGDDELPLNYAKVPRLLRGLLADYQPTPDTSSTMLRKSYFAKENADYIIVTTSEYLPAVEKFKQWKSMMGYKCKVLSSNWSQPNDVKDAVRTQYLSNEKPEYLLIIGDLGDVPSYLYDYSDKEYQTKYGSWVSDLPYVCMDGDGDNTADMAYGRIPVRNLNEAMTVIDKIIKYEKDPILDDQFYRTALHCAYFQDDVVEKVVVNGDTIEVHHHDGYEDRRFVLTSEEIRNYMMGWGKTVNRVYAANEWPTEPHYYSIGYSNGAKLPSDLYGMQSIWNGSSSDVLARFNEGAFYVLHRDHGNYDGWGDPYFRIIHVGSLTNGDKTPVVFSLNCLTGGFQKNTCFAESLLRKENGGAVGVFASTAISYSGSNDALAIGMFDAMFPSPGVDMSWGNSGSNYKFKNMDPVYNIGHVLNQGKLLMEEINGSSAYTNKIFHCFGDPSMELRTETPICLDATVEKNGTMVTVKTPVPGCRISLCSVDDGGESYVQSFDGVSEATFYEVDFNYAVTVYKHNYVPYVYSGDRYIQNQTFTTSENVIANAVWAGYNVTESQSKGDVVVKNGIVNFYANRSVDLNTGFSVALADDESSFTAQVRGLSCEASSGEPESEYHAIPLEPQEFGENAYSGDVVIQEVDASNLTQEDNFLAAGVKCYAQDGEIVVELGDVAAQVIVSDITGKQVTERKGSGTLRIKVNKGIYVVTIRSVDKKNTTKMVCE